jgi:hypothetical protein
MGTCPELLGGGGTSSVILAQSETHSPQLNPQSGSTTLSRHLLSLAKQYPLHEFESQLMGFINRLNHATSPPLLSQLDDGSVDGMSGDQFKELMRRAQVVC